MNCDDDARYYHARNLLLPAYNRLLQFFLDDAEIAGCVSKAFLHTPDSLANRSKWLAAFQKASIIC